MKPVLILKTGRTIEAMPKAMGDFEDWIGAGMALPPGRCRTVAAWLGETLPSPAQVSAVVITGSPAMVTEDADWIRRSETFTLQAIDAGLPVLGICFGHQLLAQALGGRVGWHPGGREIGTTDITLTDEASQDPLFHGLPATFPVHVTHMQSVIETPPGAVVLAGNAFESRHGMRFAEKVWGIQFHPEFSEDIITRYLKARFAKIAEEGLDPAQLLARVRPAPEARSLLARFAEMAAREG